MVLPSLDIDAVRRQASKDEVGTTFHLPLAVLVSAARLKQMLFRGGQPYWSIEVTDIVSKALQAQTDPTKLGDEAVEVVEEKIEVWGLTGWYLNVLMRTLSVYSPTEAHPPV